MLEKMHLKINTLRQELCPAAAGRHRLELPTHQKSLQRQAGLFRFSVPFLFFPANGTAVPRGCRQSGCPGDFVCVLRDTQLRSSCPAASALPG